jgi:hypothetical protein
MEFSPVKIASILFAIDSFISIFSVLPTLYYAFTQRHLPTVFGIKLLGGPFEALGIDGLIVTGLIFVTMSGLKILAAYWLWKPVMDGVVLGLILMGLSTIFWYGFALPYEFILSLAELVVLVLVWKSLI